MLKVYAAGEQFAGVAHVVKRRLFSYWYNRKNPKHILAANEMGQDLFLDSGAYTAFTQGIDIDPVQYANFIREHGHRFSCVSSLDDITSPQISYEKLKVLESLGVKVQPVYHFGEDPYWIKKYMDEGYDYVFLGGLVPQSTKDIIVWMDELWPKYLCNPDGTAKIRTHAFGVTTIDLLVRYPFYSADSTSWLFTGAMGNCNFLIDKRLYNIGFTKESPNAKKMDSMHYDNLPDIMRKQIDEWLKEHGVTPEQCAEHYKYRNMVNLATYTDMESLGVDRFVQEQMGLF